MFCFAVKQLFQD